MIARLLATLALAWMLAGCEGPWIVPAWHSPLWDHTMECQGGKEGECSLDIWETGGEM